MSLLSFAALGIPVAVVNSGLQFNQERIALELKLCLTKQQHSQLCSNSVYYAASMLGGGFITMPLWQLRGSMQIFFDYVRAYKWRLTYPGT